MEIKLGDRTYFVPDACDSSSRRKAALRKDLQEHGAEAFLASRKLSPFAGCVLPLVLESEFGRLATLWPLVVPFSPIAES